MKHNQMTILIIFIFCTILIILITFLKKSLKNKKIKRKGDKGERLVAKKLKSLAKKNGYKLINDIYLPLYDKTTQIDHILICDFGIIVIETKNYNGRIYGDLNSSNWLHIIGTQKNNMYNPILQNKTHIDCIKHLLLKEKIKNIKIESLIIFSQKKVKLLIPQFLPVIKLNSLKKYHKKLKNNNKNKDISIINVYNAILKNKVTNKKLIIDHNKNVKKIKNSLK